MTASPRRAEFVERANSAGRLRLCVPGGFGTGAGAEREFLPFLRSTNANNAHIGPKSSDNLPATIDGEVWTDGIWKWSPDASGILSRQPTCEALCRTKAFTLRSAEFN